MPLQKNLKKQGTARERLTAMGRAVQMGKDREQAQKGWEQEQKRQAITQAAQQIKPAAGRASLAVQHALPAAQKLKEPIDLISLLQQEKKPAGTPAAAGSAQTAPAQTLPLIAERKRAAQDKSALLPAPDLAGSSGGRRAFADVSDETLKLMESTLTGKLAGTSTELGRARRAGSYGAAQEKVVQAQRDDYSAQLERVRGELARRQENAYYDDLNQKLSQSESIKVARDLNQSIARARSAGAEGIPSKPMYEALRGVAHALKLETGDDPELAARYGSQFKVPQMTEDEKDTVLYYIGRGEYDKGREYLEALERTLNERANGGVQERVEQWAQEHPVQGALTNITSWPLNIPAYFDNAGQTIKNTVTGEYEPADPSRDAYVGTRIVSGTSKGVQEAARESAMQAFGSEQAGEVAAFLAGTGLSIGQNATQIAALGPYSLAGMTISAAGSATTEALDRGATPEQAFLVGTAGGAVEAVTEKLPLDNLFRIAKEGGGQGAKQVVKNLLKQAGTEATEEMISEIAGNIVDTAVMQDKSEYRQYVRELVNGGMRGDEAEKQAFLRFYVSNTLMAGAGGALSGLAMSGGATAFAEAGHYVDTLQGRKADAAIDAAYQAMGEHGAFSPEAGAAMARANDLRGGGEFSMPGIPAHDTEMTQFQTQTPERVSTPPVAQNADLTARSARESPSGVQLAPNAQIVSEASPAPAGNEAQGRRQEPIDFFELERKDRDQNGQQQRQRDRISDGGHGRVSDQGAGERAGGVARSAETAQQTAQQSRTAIERQNRAKALNLQKVSSQSLGVSQGTGNASVALWTEDTWDEGMRATADRVQRETGRQVTFVNGAIPIAQANGENAAVRGVYGADGIILQADNLSLDTDRIADHEIYHDKAARTPGLVEDVRGAIVERAGEEALARVVDAYMAKLGPLYGLNEDTTQEEADALLSVILEEIEADAYAGINYFGANAPQFKQSVEQALTGRGIGRGSTGDALLDLVWNQGGERYSIEYDQDNRPFVVVEDDILDRVPKSQWIKTVKDNLRQKFPNGVTVANSQINITGKSRNELTHSKYTKMLERTAPDVYADKLRASDDTGDILLASRGYINEGTSHPRTDDIVDFARGNVQMRIGPNDYTAEVVVAGTKNGEMLLYDISNIQPTMINVRSKRAVRGHQTADTHRQDALAPIDSISRSAEKSNTQNQKPIDLIELLKKGERYSAEEAARQATAEQEQAAAEQAERQRDERAAEILGFRRVTPIGDNAAAEAAPKKKGKKAKKSVAESKPIIAKRDLRQNMLGLFSIPEGRRAELGAVVDSFADRLLKNGQLTQTDRDAFFDWMYSEGVMTVPADEYFALGREALRDTRIYVDEKDRHEFGDDWNDFRKRAFANGIYLTNSKSDTGIDSLNMELSEMLPGLFNTDEMDNHVILERIVQVAEEGKAERMSLAEYASRMAGYEVASEDELLDNMERQMDWALRTFAEKAKLELKLRDRTGVKIAQERGRRLDMQRRQRENRALRELQQKTLKQLQWLSKNRNRAPEELKAAFDEVLGDIDIYAVNAANELRWDKRHNATWRDLADMYKQAREYDPNFLPSAELQRIVDRLDKDKIGEMEVGALQDLYRAAVGIRTEFYNRRNVLMDQEHRLFSEIYEQSKKEIEEAPGGYKRGILHTPDKLMNLDQLSAMNALERMGGWNPDGAFYSMAKQLEKGELDAQDFQVRANRLLEQFLTENEDWAKTADGQGKNGVWYELEVPELLELGKGDTPIFGDTIKVHMTPAQKVHMYLESKNYDNLRHMAGGRTFVNRELYSRGERQEAFAQGTTVRLAPETVKKLVSDLTPQEQALADILEGYYNRFAPEYINRVSNVLYGFDKTIGGNYAPIFSNQNYTTTEFGVFDTTPEGVGSLKARQYSKNPSYNISAFDAFERNIGQASRFVGYAIPKRNFETFMNWREKDASTRDVISHKWGGEATEYIDTLCTRLFSGTSTEKDTVSEGAEKLWSNYISATFGANPSIVAKQVGSVFMASAYLDYRNAPTPAQFTHIDKDLVNKYTSVLAWRGMGYATPETRQLKDNPNWSQTNKAFQTIFGGGAITATDQWAAGVLWPWAENKVRRENPELEVGTQKQIDAGLSPFYQKVAEEFNNAVMRSQSTSDEMHQGTLRKSKKLITRTLTMFKSDSSQAYNALRQAIGEAQYYKRAVDKEGYRRARRAAGSAFVSAALGNAWAAGITMLMALWKHRDKRYRDEEGELTAGSIGQEVVKDLLTSLGGLTVGGEELVGTIGDIITGDPVYGIETPGLEQFNDLVDTLIENAGSWAKALIGAKDVLDNGGDVPAYLRRHGNDILGGIKEMVQIISTHFFGLPVNNLEAYIVGTVRTVSPALGTAYDDLWATADKTRLKGLSGEALRTRMGDVLAGRLGNEDEDTTEALSALYEAGYTGAAPADTPSEISVNGEERPLSAYQRQFYDAVWKDAVGGALPELVGSEMYQGADDAAREKMVKKLYDYGAQKAKSALFEDFSPNAWVEQAARDEDGTASWVAWNVLSQAPAKESSGGEKTYTATVFDKFTGAGLEKEDALAATRAIQALQPTEGKKAVSDAQKYQAVAELGLSDRDTDTAMRTLMSEESTYKRYETAKSAGIDPVTYCTWLLQLEWANATQKAQVMEVIDDQPLTDAQKDALYRSKGYGESELKNAPWN